MYCEDTRPRSMKPVSEAHHQHSALHQRLCQAAANINLSTILLQPSQFRALKNLALDLQKATKLAVKLNAHSVHYAYKLVSTLASMLLRKICNKSSSRPGVGYSLLTS